MENIQKQQDDQELKQHDPLSDESLWKEVEAAFTKLDKNEDGKLSFKEAIEYIQNWAKTVVEESEQEKAFTFKEIDANQDRFISKDELFSFVKDMRMVHS